MKRCPDCGREYDLSMMFCLDDGAELLYGPAFIMDEPATAILSVPPASAGGDLSVPEAIATGFRGDEVQTKPQIHTTDQTAIFRTGAEAEPQELVGEHSEKQSFSASRAAEPRGKVGGRQVAVGGFRTYGVGSDRRIFRLPVFPARRCESNNLDSGPAV